MDWMYTSNIESFWIWSKINGVLMQRLHFFFLNEYFRSRKKSEINYTAANEWIHQMRFIMKYFLCFVFQQMWQTYLRIFFFMVHYNCNFIYEQEHRQYASMRWTLKMLQLFRCDDDECILNKCVRNARFKGCR